MTDTPTDRKLSERFAEARDAKVFSGALLDEAQAALRLAESHPSAIREAVEGEREACAKIADRRADSSNKDCERLSFDGSTGTLECSLSHRSDCLCQEHQEEAEAIAAAIRARGEEKGK